MRNRIGALCLAIGLLGATAAVAQGMDDMSRGSLIFHNHCANCHDDSAHMLNDSGPALFGVVGRRVGSVEGYAYSPVLQAANERGERWTEVRLDRFLKEPELMYHGTGMPMHFDKAKDRKSIIAYLGSLKAR